MSTVSSNIYTVLHCYIATLIALTRALYTVRWLCGQDANIAKTQTHMC